MYQRPFSSLSAAALLSTVFLCLGYAHTLTAQDRPQLFDGPPLLDSLGDYRRPLNGPGPELFDEPRLLDSRLDLVAPERLDPHRGETALWGVEQEKEAERLQQQIVEVAELLLNAQKAGDDEKVPALKLQLMRLGQQKQRQDRIRAVKFPHQQTQPVPQTETEPGQTQQSASPGPEQIRALHEAAERLQNSGLPEMAQELRQRAEMMEKEMIVHRERMELERTEMIARDELLERNRMKSEHASPNSERRLNELSEQVESLQRSVKELNEKLNHILELLQK